MLMWMLMIKGKVMNVFEINMLLLPTYQHCMTLGLCCFHQQVDTCQSTMMELFLQILTVLSFREEAVTWVSHYEEFLHLLKYRVR